VRLRSETIDTDIDREKRIFRRRGWVARFFKDSRVVEGDRVLLEKLNDLEYRISKL